MQSPDDLAGVLRAVHGGAPRALGEDFCGTAALSRAWVARGGVAIAVDHDAEVLARIAPSDALTTVNGDVVDDTAPDAHAADVIYVGNFSIGELHTREALLRYLRHARSRLRPGGILACDLYGGETAFLTGEVDQEFETEHGSIIYTWEQRDVDPLRAMVLNAMHFEVRAADGTSEIHRDAFVYTWRLWGVAELREALIECGFTQTQVFGKTPDAIDDDGNALVQPLEPEFLDDSFVVMVVAR